MAKATIKALERKYGKLTNEYSDGTRTFTRGGVEFPEDEQAHWACLWRAVLEKTVAEALGVSRSAVEFNRDVEGAPPNSATVWVDDVSAYDGLCPKIPGKLFVEFYVAGDVVTTVKPGDVVKAPWYSPKAELTRVSVVGVKW